ncbi:MAG: tRNA lysidine(34) synthetase TilS [Oscillospiraceae bacterium]|nr:tRNA lysidine(34) synthetase TilS [Candidatus Limimonas coprohippi]
MTSSNVFEKARSLVERYVMLKDGDRVVVGLSGGADSTALLLTLFDLKDEYNLEIIAAHLNHGIRGAEADRDEAFCKDLCERLGVRLETLHMDIPTLAKERGVSDEVAGRDARYDFFTGLAGEGGKIATAHNAQDTVETMLLNLCRGTGLKGLTGIPPVRTLGDNLVIRPLLDVSREEIEAFLKERNQDFVTDSTNLGNEYTRNRIRHNVIPELVSVNENAVGNITRCLSTLKEDSEFLESLADELLLSARIGTAYDVKTLLSSPKPVLSRAISRLVFDTCGAYPEKVHIIKTIDMMNVGRKDQVQVPTGAFVRVEKGKLLVIK